MNGRFFRCLASLGFSIMQQLLRCARMQRENQIHSMGLQERHFYSRDNYKLNRTAALTE
jgi:hypothetical protein